ncbi:MAG: hypothetical protein AAF810_07965 [Cyanobacteria bacterium P01_D01_bin.36]
MNTSRQRTGECITASRCGLCDTRLLRHLRHKQLCWFCPNCRQEMPFVRTTLKAKSTSAEPYTAIVPFTSVPFTSRQHSPTQPAS